MQLFLYYFFQRLSSFNEDAETAIKSLQAHVLKGRAIKLEHAIKPSKGGDAASKRGDSNDKETIDRLKEQHKKIASKKEIQSRKSILIIFKQYFLHVWAACVLILLIL